MTASGTRSDVLLVDIDGPTLTITINRPAARNAINLAVAREIADAIDLLDDTPELAVGIVTGAEGTFSAGMDLKAFARGERPSLPGRGFAGITAAAPAKPLIAAVEGYALAGGCEIALACDLIVAAETATFGIPEVRRGLVAAGGALLRLPGRVPLQIAMELALTGEPMDARRAHHFGLVNRLTRPGAALEDARAVAAAIAANGPLAVRASKRILRESPDWPVAEAFDRQRALSEPVITSEDAKEGAKAFAERRSPVWHGR